MKHHPLVEGQQPPQDIQALAAYAQREWLEPVLRSLQCKAQGDQELLKLLTHLSLWTLTEPRPEWGPNAVATHKDGKPIICVDLFFINQMFKRADLAGLALTGLDEAGTILYNWGFEYGQSVAQALSNQLAAPDPSFNMDHYVTDPGLRVMTKRLSLEVFFGGVAWTILHEAAHHRLKHFERHPISNEEAREWERKADSWAFSMMKKLGYSLPPVHSLLVCFEVAQEIRYMAQVEPLEIDSSHPSWATRRKELEKYHDVSEPPQGDFLVFLTFSGNDQNEFSITETWVPRYPDSEGWIFAILSGGVFLPFEWKDGQIHLYGRAADMLSEIIIHQPNKLKPEITFREIRMEDGAMSETRTRGFQVDTAWSQELGVGPLKAYQVFQSSPRKLFSQALHQIEGLPDSINAAEQVQLKMLQEVRQISIRYVRGQLSFAAAQKELGATADKASVRLKVILGPEGYARVRDSIMSHSIVKLGFDQLLSRQQREVLGIRRCNKIK